MTQLLLVVTIAGHCVAIRSDEVDSVVEIATIAPVPRAPGHVAGLASLRSRVLTVIDCPAALGIAGDAPDGVRPAVVIQRGRHAYALLVDRVEDVIEPLSELLPVNVRQGRGWEGVSLGMIETERGVLNLIDPFALIAGAGQRRAA